MLRTETLPADAPHKIADIGLSQSPDHTTLWRAFDALIGSRRYRRLLDQL